MEVAGPEAKSTQAAMPPAQAPRGEASPALSSDNDSDYDPENPAYAATTAYETEPLFAHEEEEGVAEGEETTPCAEDMGGRWWRRASELAGSHSITAVLLALLLLLLIVGFVVGTTFVVSKSREYASRAVYTRVEAVHVSEIDDAANSVAAHVLVTTGLDKSIHMPWPVNVWASWHHNITIGPTRAKVYVDHQAVARVVLPPFDFHLDPDLPEQTMLIAAVAQVQNVAAARKSIQRYLQESVASANGTAMDVQIRAVAATRASAMFGLKVPVVRTFRLPAIAVDSLATFYNTSVTAAAESLRAHADVMFNLSSLIPPTQVSVPALHWRIELDDCRSGAQPLGTADTGPFALDGDTSELRASAVVSDVPPALLEQCQHDGHSALDRFLLGYLTDRAWVNASLVPTGDPSLLERLLADIALPIALPSGRSRELVQDVELGRVHARVPKPDGQMERIILGADVTVQVMQPEGVRIDPDIKSLGGTFRLHYTGKCLAELQTASMLDAKTRHDGPRLSVAFKMAEQAITFHNYETWRLLVQRLIGGQEATVEGVASVDATVALPFGEADVNRIPGALNVTLPSLNVSAWLPTQGTDVKFSVIDTWAEGVSLRMSAPVNLTQNVNLVLPAVGMHLALDGVIVGRVRTTEPMQVKSGMNLLNATVDLSPYAQGGEEAERRTEAFLARYLGAGPAPSATLVTHADSIPDLAHLSAALANLNLSMPVPRILNGTEDVVRETRFHVISSAIELQLSNPVDAPVVLHSIQAKAFYNATHLASVAYMQPITLPPKAVVWTPYLPVEWELEEGPEIIRRALGQSLSIDTTANVSATVGAMLRPLTVPVTSSNTHAVIRL